LSANHDPELDDVLQDADLRRIVAVLTSAETPEPPLDDAYRTPSSTTSSRTPTFGASSPC